MNQDLINLTKKSVENCKANRETLQAKINRLEMEVRDAERELFKVDNVKQSLEAALERLEEAGEKERRGAELEEELREKPTKEEMEFVEKQDLPDLLEDPQELTDDEKAEAALKKADRLIVAGKKAMKEEKKGWATCAKCNKNKVAPWNKKGICSPCQLKRKTKPSL